MYPIKLTYCCWCCFFRFVDFLLESKIIPTFIFDGSDAPMKSDIHKKRQESRKSSLQLACKAIIKWCNSDNQDRAGLMKEAHKHFSKASCITQDLIAMCCKKLQDLNVHFAIAASEADSQLAFLANDLQQKFTAVLSPDLDLLTYGCPVVLFDLKPSGDLLECKISDVLNCKPQEKGQFDFSGWSLDSFQLCMSLAGCDYFKAHGIGIGKAYAAVRDCIKKNDDKIVSVAKKISLTDIQMTKWKQALQTFKHQLVFDLNEKKTVPLHPWPVDQGNLPSWLGATMTATQIKEIQLLQLNPKNFKKFTDENLQHWSLHNNKEAKQEDLEELMEKIQKTAKATLVDKKSKNSLEWLCKKFLCNLDIATQWINGKEYPDWWEHTGVMPSATLSTLLMQEPDLINEIGQFNDTHISNHKVFTCENYYKPIMDQEDELKLKSGFTYIDDDEKKENFIDQFKLGLHPLDPWITEKQFKKSEKKMETVTNWHTTARSDSNLPDNQHWRVFKVPVTLTITQRSMIHQWHQVYCTIYNWCVSLQGTHPLTLSHCNTGEKLEIKTWNQLRQYLFNDMLPHLMDRDNQQPKVKKKKRKRDESVDYDDDDQQEQKQSTDELQRQQKEKNPLNKTERELLRALQFTEMPRHTKDEAIKVFWSNRAAVRRRRGLKMIDDDDDDATLEKSKKKKKKKKKDQNDDDDDATLEKSKKKKNDQNDEVDNQQDDNDNTDPVHLYPLNASDTCFTVPLMTGSGFSVKWDSSDQLQQSDGTEQKKLQFKLGQDKGMGPINARRNNTLKRLQIPFGQDSHYHGTTQCQHQSELQREHDRYYLLLPFIRVAPTDPVHPHLPNILANDQGIKRTHTVAAVKQNGTKVHMIEPKNFQRLSKRDQKANKLKDDIQMKGKELTDLIKKQKQISGSSQQQQKKKSSHIVSSSSSNKSTRTISSSSSSSGSNNTTDQISEIEKTVKKKSTISELRKEIHNLTMQQFLNQKRMKSLAKSNNISLIDQLLTDFGCGDIVLMPHLCLGDLMQRVNPSSGQWRSWPKEHVQRVRLLQYGHMESRMKDICQNRGIKFFQVSETLTSKGCCRCGVINRDFKNEEMFECHHCPNRMHRDINAALNILLMNFKIYVGQFDLEIITKQVLGQDPFWEEAILMDYL